MRSGGAKGKLSATDQLSRAGHGFPADERLVTLNIHNGAVLTESRILGYFSHAFRAGVVLATRHYAVRASLTHRSRNGLIIRSDDHGFSDVHLEDSLPDPGDERESREEAEGRSGEAQGAEASWNHYKRPHLPPGFSATAW